MFRKCETLWAFVYCFTRRRKSRVLPWNRTLQIKSQRSQIPLGLKKYFGELLSTVYSVLHQHGHGHGTNATRYRCDVRSNFCRFFVVDITYQTLARFFGGIWQKITNVNVFYQRSFFGKCDEYNGKI